MSIRKDLKKRMKALDSSGRGRFYEGAEKGQVLLSTKLEGGRLDIYMDGFSFGEGEGMCKVMFSEVVSINSHLRVEMFSSASASGELDFYVPLDVKCGASSLTLSLPFLAYSNVLNILIGLNEAWMKKPIDQGGF